VTNIGSVCVFTGSRPGNNPAHLAATKQLAVALAERDITAVYGGGDVGLMGILADEVMAAGGRVEGVIPKGLFSQEVPHRGITVLHEVGSMHERKALMYQLSDAFIALPGGLGTLEEFAEIVTWMMIGLHDKPAALLNVNGYWSPLIAQLDAMVNAGFLSPEKRRLIVDYPEVTQVLDGLGAL
jgi:uncharacterized protein (TIGR00730 family)